MPEVALCCLLLIFFRIHLVFVPLHQRPTFQCSWMPPSTGSIKINADGSFLVDTRRSGIGGIFRNHLGHTVLLFCKEILADSVVHSEILAIREDLLLPTASRWSSSTHFCIESDCVNAVEWFNDINKTPWKLRNIIRESLQVFGRYISWTISHI